MNLGEAWYGVRQNPGEGEGEYRVRRDAVRLLRDRVSIKLR